MICPETTISDAVELADKVRLQLAAIRFDPFGTQTVSCGVAELKSPQSLNEWISHADKCLYQAKQQGRNRVVSG